MRLNARIPKRKPTVYLNAGRLPNQTTSTLLSFFFFAPPKPRSRSIAVHSVILFDTMFLCVCRLDRQKCIEHTRGRGRSKVNYAARSWAKIRAIKVPFANKPVVISRTSPLYVWYMYLCACTRTSGRECVGGGPKHRFSRARAPLHTRAFHASASFDRALVCVRVFLCARVSVAFIWEGRSPRENGPGVWVVADFAVR